MLFFNLHITFVITIYCLFISVKFMISRDGESLMKLGDFTFTRQLYVENKWCWSCYTHNNHGCPAKVYTELNKLIYAKNYHNHPPTEFFVWHFINFWRRSLIHIHYPYLILFSFNFYFLFFMVYLIIVMATPLPCGQLFISCSLLLNRQKDKNIYLFLIIIILTLTFIVKKYNLRADIFIRI